MQLGLGFGKGRRVIIKPAYTRGFAIARLSYTERLQRALAKQQRWVDTHAAFPEKLRMAKASLRPVPR